jgi:DNA-binding LacI/PurR family transcriptional regulator
MTLSKLAQLANVSVSVVSKAFSGKDGVSDSMREHVFAVAKEHGCFEQFYHVPYDKPVVAVIIPEAISEYYIRNIQALKKGLEQGGYTMLMSISNFDIEMTRELIRYYTEHSKVDAIVVFGGLPECDCKTDTALVSVSKATVDFGSFVEIYLDSGLERVIRRLYELGHRRIAYVGEPLTEGKREKTEQLLRDFEIAGYPELMICSRYRFAEAGKDGAKKLLALEDRPTAILGAYGYITQGILAELEENGVLVPEDISVLSIGDDPLPLNPSLDVSYISSMTDEVCCEVMNILKARIRSKNPNAFQRIEILPDFYEGRTISKAMEK